MRTMPVSNVRLMILTNLHITNLTNPTMLLVAGSEKFFRWGMGTGLGRSFAMVWTKSPPPLEGISL